jgi:geranylgeranyl pyrophosphate synthase
MAIPVGACLRLLGVVSCALDAAHDGHHKLVGACGNDSPQDSAYQCDPRRSAALLSNIGVALIGVAWKLLLEYGPRYGATRETLMTIGQLIADRWATICRAQHLDLTAGRSPLLSLEEYDAIVAGKAGEIGGTACEAAAILAGVSKQRALWHKLGLTRTIAQQLCDDFRDLDHDLANGQQVSQPVLYGLRVAPEPKRGQLLRLLAQARGNSRTAGRARRALILELEDLGAVHFALASLAVHRQQAIEALVALQLAPPLHQWFLQWILDTTVVPRLADMESRRNGGS